MEKKPYDLGQQIDNTQPIEQKEITLATQLNTAFKKEELIDQYKKTLQSIDKPILVDFNNVLVNDDYELEPNPYAKEFITELEKVGQVIVITKAENWDFVNKKLVEFGLWTNKMVLITKENFYIDNLDRSRYEISQEDFVLLEQRVKNTAPEHKRVGETFGKDFDIPLIDDNVMATNNNPGIYGIHIEPWFGKNDHIRKQFESMIGNPNLEERKLFEDKHKGKIDRFKSGLSGETLKKAINKVKKIYKKNPLK